MKKSRDSVLDSFRGLIIILMALDHSITFVAKHSIGSEVWGISLPVHGDSLSFFIRWISHLCAPGFSFLVGVSLVLLLNSRMSKGWSICSIRNFLIKRGIIIIILQHVIYNGAWFIYTKTSNMPSMPFPGSGGMPLLAFSILSALGVSMIFWSFLLNAKTSVIVGLSVLGILSTQIIVPGTENVDTLYHPIIRLLFIPGQTGIWLIRFPFIPWVSIVGIGIVWGRILLSNKFNAYRVLKINAVIFIMGFVIIRLFNGFGNTHSWSSGFFSFMHVTKFPPSIAYVLITLGICFAVIGLLYKFKDKYSFVYPLTVFGNAPLFFYFTHIYLYLIMGLLFPKGIDILNFLPLWIAGLLILYFPCLKYGEFKQQLPINSFWKMF